MVHLKGPHRVVRTEYRQRERQDVGHMPFFRVHGHSDLGFLDYGQISQFKLKEWSFVKPHGRSCLERQGLQVLGSRGDYLIASHIRDLYLLVILWAAIKASTSLKGPMSVLGPCNLLGQAKWMLRQQ